MWVDEIARDFTDENMPFEVWRLGRTIGKWRETDRCLASGDAGPPSTA